MVIAIVSGFMLVLAGSVVVWGRSWRRLVRRRVVVVLDTERTLNGVLWRHRGGLLVLRDASTLQGERQVRFDGDVVVDRRTVQWLQVLP